MLFKFKNKQIWAKECMNRGAKNHIAEVNTYTDMGQEHMKEYAVGAKNSGLYGTWDPIQARRRNLHEALASVLN